MHGHCATDGIITAHEESIPLRTTLADRHTTEEYQASALTTGATLAHGAGDRPQPEEPDAFRTCFERDRDRILHSSAFRRLAGKTQVFIFPADHQRTRLTHALEVSQVAVAISRHLRLNTDLTEAIALGHDCGHGPGGHASEVALEPFLSDGFDHAPWGAYVTLSHLNLCKETTDGIANHSWSRPKPMTPEAEVVALADRIAYCAHDLEDAIDAGLLPRNAVPSELSQLIGPHHTQQLDYFITDVISTSVSSGTIGLSAEAGEALAGLRAFNYTRIYTTQAAERQSESVIAVLRSLTEYLIEHPKAMPQIEESIPIERQVVAYVAGMTDRYAFRLAHELIHWPTDRLPLGIDLGA
ncbi:HD domain-containing protein [Ferrimicrobium sp.]|uniref:HD domain-containing protein n=1 Tax=Ferrimicrobium sp. TaxID=2926050 RepID=UPI00344BB1E2